MAIMFAAIALFDLPMRGSWLDLLLAVSLFLVVPKGETLPVVLFNYMKFDLDGATWRLPANNGRNTIHGGNKGFAQRVWTLETTSAKTHAASARLTYLSRDGDFTAELARNGRPAVLVAHKAVLRALLALATGWDMTGRQPVKLDWHCLQYFAATPDGRVTLERPNVTLATP